MLRSATQTTLRQARTSACLASVARRPSPVLLAPHATRPVFTTVMGVGVSALAASVALQHGRAWMAKPRAAKRYKGGFEDPMSRREAQLLLGMKTAEVDDKKAVMTAYKVMMSINHPDKGGSQYIATKINEARDHLVRGKA